MKRNVMDDRRIAILFLERMEGSSGFDLFDFALLHILRVSSLPLQEAMKLADLLVD